MISDLREATRPPHLATREEETSAAEGDGDDPDARDADETAQAVDDEVSDDSDNPDPNN